MMRRYARGVARKSARLLSMSDAHVVARVERRADRHEQPVRDRLSIDDAQRDTAARALRAPREAQRVLLMRALFTSARYG